MFGVSPKLGGFRLHSLTKALAKYCSGNLASKDDRLLKRPEWVETGQSREAE